MSKPEKERVISSFLCLRSSIACCLLGGGALVGQTRQIRQVNDSLFPCRKNKKFYIGFDDSNLAEKR